MNPQTPESIKPILQRWETFIEKLNTRYSEVLAEANAGFDEIIQLNAIEPAALGGAFGAFEGRVHGLRDKIGQAWDKIEQELDNVLDDLDEPEDREPIYPIRDRERSRARTLERQIEDQAAVLQIHKAADAARALGEAAQKETKKTITCSHCKAELAVPTPYKAISITCAHCQSVNSYSPGTLMAMYYQGGALHNLAKEAAKDAWLAQHHAEQLFKSIRLPTEEDVARYEAAVLAYAHQYTQAMGTLHPEWNADQSAKEIQVSRGRFANSFQPIDRALHQARSKALALATAGDRSAAVSLMQTQPNPGAFAEECAECAFVHD